MFDCVAVFLSIHDVMAAEKALKEKRIRHDVVPVPRSMSSDCGMAIDLCCADAPRVTELLRAGRIGLRAIVPR